MSSNEKTKRIAVLLITAALALTLARPSVTAAPLARSICRAGGIFGEDVNIAAPVTAHYEWQDGGHKSVVSIVTTFGKRPMADVQVHSSCVYGTMYTSGSAQVIYYAGVDQLGQTPPNPPDEVPVRITMRGHASSDDGGTAQARLNIGPYYYCYTPPDFDKTVTLWAEIDTTYMVWLDTICTASSSESQGRFYVEAQAVVDPLFEFDQDTFDAWRAGQGLPTFNLADYYEFQFSPNILAGDFDEDGDVDFVDFSILAGQWMQGPGEPSADIAPAGEPDGIVDFLDLAVFCAYWHKPQFSAQILVTDFNGDGDIDFVDFSILAGQWMQGPGEPSADIAPVGEPDGIVDFLDLAVFCTYWLEGTNP